MEKKDEHAQQLLEKHGHGEPADVDSIPVKTADLPNYLLLT